MSKLVKQSQLKDITVDLWEKAKDNYKVSFKEAQYNDVTKKITFTSIEGLTEEVEITDLTNLQTNLDSKVNIADTTAVGGVGNNDKVVKLDATGKLDVSMIPDLAITSVTATNDDTSAQKLVTDGTIQVGDVVVLTADKNRVFMCKNTVGLTFDDNFIELSMGDGAIKNVNGQVANGTGKVTLNATHIELSTGEIVEDELNSKIKTINNVAPVAGNIDITLDHGTDTLELKANGTKLVEFELMTDLEVQNIKALFV